MILLLRDWLELAKKRKKAMILGVVSLSLMFPSTIQSKGAENQELSNLDYNQVRLEVEEINNNHQANSESGSADKEPAKKVKKVKKAIKPKVSKTINVTATAYTSTPDQCWGNPFITASGKRVYDGLIAANGLSFGTKVRFPDMYGDKVFTVNDRMSSRYGLGRVDIWMDGPRSKALNFGRRSLKMEILES